MNLPALNINIDGPQAGTVGTLDEGPASLLGGSQSIDAKAFSEVMESPEVLSSVTGQLRELLPDEEFARIEALLANGKELPQPAELAALLNEIAQRLEAADVQGEKSNITPASELIDGESPLLITEEGGLPTRILQILKGRASDDEAGDLPLMAGNDATDAQVAASMQKELGIVARQSATNAVDHGLAMPQAKEAGFQLQNLSMAVKELTHSGVNPDIPQPGENLIAEMDLPGNDSDNGIGVYLQTTMGQDAPQRAIHLSPPALGVPLRDQSWGQGLGDRLHWMISQNLQHATLRINPAHLGPIEINISMQNDQASIAFHAQHGAVKEAIEAAIPRLREMFSDNNLQLVNVDVGQWSEDGQRTAAEHFQRQGGERGFGVALPGAQAMDDEALSGPSSVLRTVTNGLVDDYA